MKKLFAVVTVLMLITVSATMAERIPFTEWLEQQTAVAEQPIVQDEPQVAEGTALVAVSEAEATEEPYGGTPEEAYGESTEEALPEFAPIEMGSRGIYVETLQEKLNELGFPAGRADGIFGPMTETALKTVQKALGWEETGKVETEEELNTLLVLKKGDGINLLGDIEYSIEKDNKNESAESVTFEIDPEIYDLQSFIGQTLTASIYVYSPGERGSSVSDPSDYMYNRFGCHVVVRWSDSSGKLEDISTYPATELLSQTVDGQRIAARFTIAAPEGYDTIRQIGLSVQSGARPADSNNAIWILSAPKLERGSFPTEL